MSSAARKTVRGSRLQNLLKKVRENEKDSLSDIDASILDALKKAEKSNAGKKKSVNPKARKLKTFTSFCDSPSEPCSPNKKVEAAKDKNKNACNIAATPLRNAKKQMEGVEIVMSTPLHTSSHQMRADSIFNLSPILKNNPGEDNGAQLRRSPRKQADNTQPKSPRNQNPVVEEDHPAGKQLKNKVQEEKVVSDQVRSSPRRKNSPLKNKVNNNNPISSPVKTNNQALRRFIVSQSHMESTPVNSPGRKKRDALFDVSPIVKDTYIAEAVTVLRHQDKETANSSKSRVMSEKRKLEEHESPMKHLRLDSSDTEGQTDSEGDNGASPNKASSPHKNLHVCLVDVMPNVDRENGAQCDFEVVSDDEDIFKAKKRKLKAKDLGQNKKKMVPSGKNTNKQATVQSKSQKITNSSQKVRENDADVSDEGNRNSSKEHVRNRTQSPERKNQSKEQDGKRNTRKQSRRGLTKELSSPIHNSRSIETAKPEEENVRNRTRSSGCQNQSSERNVKKNAKKQPKSGKTKEGSSPIHNSKSKETSKPEEGRNDAVKNSNVENRQQNKKKVGRPPLANKNIAKKGGNYAVKNSNVKNRQQNKKKAGRLSLAEKNAVNEGIRRSNRTKIPPIDYWCQRIIYKPTENKCREIVGVTEKPPRKDFRFGTKRSSPTQKKGEEKKKKVINSFLDLPINIVNNPVSPSKQKAVNNSRLELDGEREYYVPLKEIAFVAKSLPLDSGQECTILTSSVLRFPNGISGYIHLKPNTSKGLQRAKSNRFMYVVISGKLDVTVNYSNWTLQRGEIFQVPPGVCYNITNNGTTPAVLVYVRMKDDSNVIENGSI